jgi:hypothetical protein
MTSPHTFARRAGAAASVTALLTQVGCTSGFGSSFEGQVTARRTSASGPALTMTIKAKGDKLRVELPGADGKPASALFFPKDNKIVVLYDAQKRALETDLGSPVAPLAGGSSSAIPEKTGKKETIAGISCEDYVAKEESGGRTEACIAKGLPYFDMESLKHGGETSQWSRDMRANRTFPLRSVVYDAKDKEVSRFEVNEVRKTKLDDSLFEVPSDYQVAKR